MADAEGGSLSILITIVAGLSSLLGAFAGAALSRKSDHLKWLRENQSEVFASFLEKLQAARHTAFELKVEHAKDESKRSWEITKAFGEAMRHERIVRLYLKDGHREEFSELVQKYWKATAKDSENNSEPSEPSAKHCINRIQEIFENELRG